MLIARRVNGLLTTFVINDTIKVYPYANLRQLRDENDWLMMVHGFR